MGHVKKKKERRLVLWGRGQNGWSFKVEAEMLSNFYTETFTLLFRPDFIPVVILCREHCQNNDWIVAFSSFMFPFQCFGILIGANTVWLAIVGSCPPRCLSYPPQSEAVYLRWQRTRLVLTSTFTKPGKCSPISGSGWHHVPDNGSLAYYVGSICASWILWITPCVGLLCVRFQGERRP